MRLETTKTGQRGVALTEYALTFALLVFVTIAAIGVLEENSGDAIVATGDQIGEPRATMEELRQNPNTPAAVDPQNPPPGPPADLFNPPAPQPTPSGYAFVNINYQSGYASPSLDLNPDSAIPYQSDTVAFLFNEGGGPPAASPFVAPNSTGVLPNLNVCSMYLHYTPQTSGNIIGPVSVQVPGDIIGYAATNSELDNTDTYLGGSLPAGGLDFRGDRAFEGSEIAAITISGGNTFTVSSLQANNNNTDEIRIFYNC